MLLTISLFMERNYWIALCFENESTMGWFWFDFFFIIGCFLLYLDIRNNHSQRQELNNGKTTILGQEKYQITEFEVKNPYLKRILRVGLGSTVHFIVLIFTMDSITANCCVGLFFVLIFVCQWKIRQKLKCAFHFLQISWYQITYSHDSTKTQKILFYHAGVQILQCPFLKQEMRKDQIDFSRINSSSGKPLFFNVEAQRSWLCDVFGPEFSVQFSVSNGISWKVFRKVKLLEDAKNIASVWKIKLQTLFPGLECIPYVREISLQDILEPNPQKFLQEVILPHPPYPQKISLIETLITLAKNHSNNLEIQLILTQCSESEKNRVGWTLKNAQFDSLMKREIEPLWVGNTYSIQIFLEEHVDQPRNHIREQNFPLSQTVVYKSPPSQPPSHTLFTMGDNFRNINGKTSSLRKCSNLNRLNRYFVSSNRFQLITATCGDFDFQPITFLKHAKKIPDEIVHPLSDAEISPQHIDLGFICRLGVPEQLRAYISIDSLPMNMLIAGSPGVGKSVLLQNIVGQITQSHPHVGILIVNTSKVGEDMLYPNFQVWRYGTNTSVRIGPNVIQEKFVLPYGIISPYREWSTSIKRLSRILAAAVGLTDFMDRYFSTPLSRYYVDKHILPNKINLPFALALGYLEQNPYAGKEQQNIIQALSMRGRELCEDEIFMNSTQILPDLPSWLQGFLTRGEKIFLDLSACDKMIKQFLVMSLLHAIDSYTCQINQHDRVQLNHLLVFDEAHDIFEKAQEGHVETDDNVRQIAVTEVVKPYLLEYRSRGIGMIISDQRPSALIPAIKDSTGIKCLFRIGLESAQIYTNKSELQELLQQQPQFRCILRDDTRGELYQIQTHPTIH